MSLFSIQSHKVPTAYIREYPRATAGSQEDELHLAVKQYTPLDNKSPKAGDVTIIGAHANGFPKVQSCHRLESSTPLKISKELYEPLWDELHGQLKSKGINIRSIWIADVAHQGESGVLNESKLGNDRKDPAQCATSHITNTTFQPPGPTTPATSSSSSTTSAPKSGAPSSASATAWAAATSSTSPSCTPGSSRPSSSSTP